MSYRYKKVRLLIFLRYVGYQSGGVQHIVDSYYSRFDLEKFDIEYLVLTHEEISHEKKLIEQGIRIHTVKGIPERNLWLLFISCQEFFKEHHDYDIIHCHQTNFDFIPLLWAKHYKIPIRIIQSHNTGFNINYPQFLCEKYLTRIWANYFMAASEDSGRFLFGKQITESGSYTVVKSAIEIEKYAFDLQKRETKRKELSLPNDIIAFCQVARMSPEKRQEITIKAFSIIHKTEPNCRLYFVGDGDEYTKYLKKIVDELDIKDTVMFLGTREDVPDLLQAFDVFVMPSLFEAMLIALTEALASGMPCLISDAVGCMLSSENGVERIKTDAPIEAWAEGMIRCMKMQRRNNINALYEAGLSINHQVTVLQEKYKRMVQNEYNC